MTRGFNMRIEIEVSESSSRCDLNNFYAVLRGYEPNEPRGEGKTKYEAIIDLINQLEQVSA
jgi:hypothetical protein